MLIDGLTEKYKIDERKRRKREKGEKKTFLDGNEIKIQE